MNNMLAHYMELQFTQKQCKLKNTAILTISHNQKHVLTIQHTHNWRYRT